MAAACLRIVALYGLYRHLKAPIVCPTPCDCGRLISPRPAAQPSPSNTLAALAHPSVLAGVASRHGYIKVEVVIDPEPEAVSELSGLQEPLCQYHLFNRMVSNTRPGTMNVWVTRLNAKAKVGLGLRRPVQVRLSSLSGARNPLDPRVQRGP